MLAPLVRDLNAAELPVLEAHGLSMWGYSVLVALDRSAIRTQAALAEAIGADKTRIIAILDELQQNGLIERVADPEDRRARLLAITKKGRRVKEATQTAIQRGEERWLGTLSASDRATFLRVIQELSGPTSSSPGCATPSRWQTSVRRIGSTSPARSSSVPARMAAASCASSANPSSASRLMTSPAESSVNSRSTMRSALAATRAWKLTCPSVEERTSLSRKSATAATSSTAVGRPYSQLTSGRLPPADPADPTRFR